MSPPESGNLVPGTQKPRGKVQTSVRTSPSQAHSILRGSCRSQDTHNRPGAALACGSVAASSPPSLAFGAGGATTASPGHAPPHFRLPGWLRLFVCLSCRAQLV